MTPGRSTLYQSTVAGGLTRNRPVSSLAGAEVHDNGVGAGGERAHPVVEHLGAQGGLAHHAVGYTERGEVVVDLADDAIGERVAQNGPRPSAVQCSGVLGQQCGLLERGEVADVNAWMARPITEKLLGARPGITQGVPWPPITDVRSPMSGATLRRTGMSTSERPTTLCEAFQRTVAIDPDAVALRTRATRRP